jgi:hypothetical protein
MIILFKILKVILNTSFLLIKRVILIFDNLNIHVRYFILIKITIFVRKKKPSLKNEFYEKLFEIALFIEFFKK